MHERVNFAHLRDFRIFNFTYFSSLEWMQENLGKCFFFLFIDIYFKNILIILSV